MWYTAAWHSTVFAPHSSKNRCFQWTVFFVKRTIKYITAAYNRQTASKLVISTTRIGLGLPNGKLCQRTDPTLVTTDDLLYNLDNHPKLPLLCMLKFSTTHHDHLHLDICDITVEKLSGKKIGRRSLWSIITSWDELSRQSRSRSQYWTILHRVKDPVVPTCTNRVLSHQSVVVDPSINHTVNTCPVTKFDGCLPSRHDVRWRLRSQLTKTMWQRHSRDEDENYQRWQSRMKDYIATKAGVLGLLCSL